MSDLGNREVFSRNLRTLMQQLGKTRNQICDDLDFKYSTFNDWYNGNKYPRIDKIEMLANYFGVLKSDLIEDKGVPSNLCNKGGEGMPTEKPRITITMSSEQLARIDDYRFGNKIRNQTQAILSLIELGLSDLDGTKITAPSLSDEAVKVGAAYDEAQPGVKFSVRKLLDIEPQMVPAAARGGNLREVEAISKNELPEKDSEIP